MPMSLLQKSLVQLLKIKHFVMSRDTRVLFVSVPTLRTWKPSCENHPMEQMQNTIKNVVRCTDILQLIEPQAMPPASRTKWLMCVQAQIVSPRIRFCCWLHASLNCHV
eukprot:6473222-Amphidinium_carterae.1